MRELKLRAYIKPLKRYATGLDTIQFHKCCDVAGAGIWTVATVDEGIFEGDDIVIEQYTGLKDQYGKDICEGDIIKVAESIKGYVTQDVEGRWIIFGDNRKPIEGYITLGELENIPEINLRTILATEYCSIIGNIHEHQELLGDINVTNKEEK